MSTNQIITGLKDRFENNMHRHQGLNWKDVEARLLANQAVLETVSRMEQSGGEPDCIDLETIGLCYIDFSKETPIGRRNVCYDRKALDGRKANKPGNDALSQAAEIGITLLDENQYRFLQKIEAFDLKSSSWVFTPEAVRSKGGALFCDRRYDHVFTYHNGADSYYGVRGFRGYIVL